VTLINLYLNYTDGSFTDALSTVVDTVRSGMSWGGHGWENLKVFGRAQPVMVWVWTGLERVIMYSGLFMGAGSSKLIHNIYCCQRAIFISIVKKLFVLLLFIMLCNTHWRIFNITLKTDRK